MTDISALRMLPAKRLPDFIQAFREMMSNTYQTDTQGEGPNREQNRKYSFLINFSFRATGQVAAHTITFRHDKGFGRE